MKEKLRNASAFIVTGTVLLAALLLPLAFRPGSVSKEPNAQERTDMFLDFWEGDSEGVTVTKLAEPDKSDKERCEENFARLTKYYLPDNALSWSEPTGSEYVVLKGEAGELKLCRMWLRAMGDWQNWLDAYFNVKTGELYYLYASCECLNRQWDYYDSFGGELTPERAASITADYCGESVKMSTGDSRPYRAFFLKNGDIICREVECSYHAAVIFELRVSVR